MDSLPDLPSKCLYNKNNLASYPHGNFITKSCQKIKPNILHAIGNTPLVKLNRIPQCEGIKCEMLAKCEFQNPGGSIKDRIALSMIEDAEIRGLLKPGSTIIEPTSGNTGIALAMISAVKGYNCICVVPEKTSSEKEQILNSLGAKIVRIANVPYDAPDGVFGVSQQIKKATPNSIILHQYKNSANPLTHYHTTSMEIFDQCEGKLDMVVMGAGTGGTMTGVGRKLKELLPDCVIVGVDPVGSLIALPPSINETDITHYEIEGMGHNFIPTVLDRSISDFWVKVDDKTSFTMARRLHREEGLLCGASSGSIMSGALKAAASLQEGQKCVVLFPDGVGNYLTKFVSHYWMEAKNFTPCVNTLNHWWWDHTVSKLVLKHVATTSHCYYFFLSSTSTCEESLKIMKAERHDVLPCADRNKILLGIVSAHELINKLINGTVKPNDPIGKVVSHNFRKVTLNSILGELSHIFEKEPVAVVVEKQNLAHKINYKLEGFLVAADLLDYITKK